MKRKFLELLEKDVEFRYSVAGYLGLSEILKKLDRSIEEQTKIWTEISKIWEEIRKLREDMIASFKRHDEMFARHEEQLVKLREDMVAGFKRHDEMFARHEEQLVKLREDMVAGFKRHDEEIAKLREDMATGFRVFDNRMGSLERRMGSLEERMGSLESAMMSGFGELSRFAGLTFEEFVRRFLTERLRRSSEIPEDAELRRGLVEGEEVNLFLENPLIVGEVTGYAESVDEMLKLLRKAELAKAKYSREPRKILVILTAKRDVAKEVKRIAEEKGVELVIGKTVD